MNPSLLPEQMAKVYNSEAYWKHTSYVNYMESEPVRVANAERRFRLCSPFIAPTGRLLDVACATGFFAHVAERHGYQVIGIDPARELVEFGQAAYGLDLRVASIESVESFEPGSFDAVSLWGADSHFSDMRGSFEKIARWLKPGGCLLLNYQDYGHWIRRLFPGIKQEANVYYAFSRPSLLLFLTQLGLEPVLHRTEIQITQLHRVTRTLGFRKRRRFDDLRIRIPTPSYRIVVARKIRA